MRHQKAHRHLGRSPSHRLALLRNLTRSLIEHERIVTTLEKAKELRPYVEKLITLAKKGTLHARRLVIAQDTGGAIKGPIRGDVFWGAGDVAGEIAGRMKSEGGYVLLLPKSLTPTS